MGCGCRKAKAAPLEPAARTIQYVVRHGDGTATTADTLPEARGIATDSADRIEAVRLAPA